jgi:galactokinase
MEVRDLFKRAFSHAPPWTIRVPGSLELLGGSTESEGGLVFSTAVDRGVTIACVPRTDGKIELIADEPRQRVRLWPRECVPGGAPGWALPVLAVVHRLREMGAAVRGFNAAWSSDIPKGTGMGDQAAEIVAAALALRRVFPFSVTETGLGAAPTPDRQGRLPQLTVKDGARWVGFCRAAERAVHAGEDRAHGFVAPLVNPAFGASQLDCLHWSIERHTFTGGFALIFCDTGIRDHRRGMHQSRFEVTGRRAARALGLKSLRSLAAEEVSGRLAALAPAERGVARFVAGECARVVAAEVAMRCGDLGQFGECLFQSHAAARAEAGLTAPELDLLVALARRHPACIGARFTGGGADGGTLNLVAPLQVASFVEHIRRGYHAATGRLPEVLRLKPSSGVLG